MDGPDAIDEIQRVATVITVHPEGRFEYSKFQGNLFNSWWNISETEIDRRFYPRSNKLKDSDRLVFTAEKLSCLQHFSKIIKCSRILNNLVGALEFRKPLRWNKLLKRSDLLREDETTSSTVVLTVSFQSHLKYRPLWASGSRAFSLSSSAILRRRARRSAADEESWGRRGARRSRREGSPKLLKSSGYSESHVLNTVHTALQKRGEKNVKGRKIFYLSLLTFKTD